MSVAEAMRRIGAVTGGRSLTEDAPAPLQAAVLRAIRGEGTAPPRLDDPESLPLSQSFVQWRYKGVITLRASYPDNWPQIKSELRRSRPPTCECCGLPEGGTYLKETGEGPVEMIQGRLQVAHRDHQPDHIAPDNLLLLCNRCHGLHDALHHAGMSLLSQSSRGEAGTRAVYHKLFLIAEAVERAASPLGALTVGGADLLIAWMESQQLPVTPAALRRLLPPLEVCPDADIEAVIEASRARLARRSPLRGLPSARPELPLGAVSGEPPTLSPA